MSPDRQKDLALPRRVGDLAGSPDRTPVEDKDEMEFGYTVVEISAPVAHRAADGDWYPAIPSSEALHDAFERSVHVLFLLIRACRACHKEASRLYAPTRERLGSLMLFSTRAHADVAHWDAKATAMLLAMALPLEQATMSSLDDAVMVKMQEYFHAEIFANPAVAIIELRLDARAALDRSGDTRTAVLLSHIATEVALDETLMLMQWEDGLSASDAAAPFARSLVERVRSEYHDRLGGAWDTRATERPVARWRQDLVLLRHRVAHTGYAPDREQAERALRAQREMNRFLLDRLAARCKKYPKTAGLMVSEAGFKRRGALTRAAREAVASAHVEAMLPFREWREELSERRGLT